MLVVRFASLFDVKDRTVTFLGGKKYSVDTLRAMGAGDLLNSMFDFSEKLINLSLSEEEMSLFTAVVLVAAGWLFCHFSYIRFRVLFMHVHTAHPVGAIWGEKLEWRHSHLGYIVKLMILT